MCPRILIRSLQPGGHYRAGRCHPACPTAWDESAFTPEELALLRGDPRLEITVEDMAASPPQIVGVPVQLTPRLADAAVPAKPEPAAEPAPEGKPAVNPVAKPKPAAPTKGAKGTKGDKS